MVKTSLNQHLLRSDVSPASYQEIKNSESVVNFGKKYLSVPGIRAGIKERVFLDQNPSEVLNKKEEDGKKPEEGKTISGISSKFEYICKVINIIILKLTMLLCSIIGDW